jgi:hypothetical protein
LEKEKKERKEEIELVGGDLIAVGGAGLHQPVWWTGYVLSFLNML